MSVIKSGGFLSDNGDLYQLESSAETPPSEFAWEVAKDGREPCPTLEPIFDEAAAAAPAFNFGGGGGARHHLPNTAGALGGVTTFLIWQVHSVEEEARRRRRQVQAQQRRGGSALVEAATRRRQLQPPRLCQPSPLEEKVRRHSAKSDSARHRAASR